MRNVEKERNENHNILLSFLVKLFICDFFGWCANAWNVVVFYYFIRLFYQACMYMLGKGCQCRGSSDFRDD